MKGFLSLLIAAVGHPWRYRELIWQLTKREVAGRYRGSMLGLLWSFFNPIFMLAVYTFFFSIVYQARGGVAPQNKLEFALNLFAGLIPFTLFTECINRSPYLMINNINYVKKVIFPLEILPWVNLGAALFHAGISFLVLIGFSLVINHSVPWTLIFLPLVNLPLVFLILGMMWFLASLGVFIRDVTHTVTMFTMALLFLSPVFYSISAVPLQYQDFINWNPLTAIIEQNRAILILGQLPNWSQWEMSLSVGLLVAAFGFFWFKQSKPAFADII